MYVDGPSQLWLDGKSWPQQQQQSDVVQRLSRMRALSTSLFIVLKGLVEATGRPCLPVATERWSLRSLHVCTLFGYGIFFLLFRGTFGQWKIENTVNKLC